MSPVSLVGNHSLDRAATGNLTSTVGEPSAAGAGQNVFATGNWYAASSVDGGANWGFIDPFNFLQPAAASQFCCDQVVLHDRRRGIWIWILQYSRDTSGTNVFRVAFTHDDVFPRGWRFWEVGPARLNSEWSNLWFDYPDASLTADNLYVSFNVFNNSSPASWQHAAVMRFPLDAIAAGGALSMQAWTTDALGSLRLTQGAAGTMYWGGHAAARTLRLFAWPDGQAPIASWDVNIADTNRTVSSIAPNGVDWLSRADWRITGGALADGTITFMWTSGSDARHPNAYCRVARISEATKQLVDEPDIWSRTHAWAYPAIAPNAAGRMGFTAFYGSGDQNPSHVVGVRDDAANSWGGVFAKHGGGSPAEAKWGDYLTCRAKDDFWVATGYTLEGGDTRDSIVPRVVEFALRA